MTNCAFCGREMRSGTAFCPGCGKPSIPPGSQGAVTQKSGKPLWFIALTAAVFIVFGYLFFDHLPGGDHPVIAEQPEVRGAASGGHADQVPVSPNIEGSDLSIPLADVVRNRIVEFSYNDGTVTIPLLAYISGQGKLVTAFRFCEPCNSTRYSIDGDRLSCGNCETQWSLNNLEGLQGSCQKYPPEPFPSVIRGDRIVMSLERIRAWKIRL